MFYYTLELKKHIRSLILFFYICTIKFNYMQIKKSILLLFLVFYSINLFSQVPSYVPQTGLVGWWPFNGNANDESGNGNNGSVNGATLTNNRSGISNQAYSFDGNDNITLNSLTIKSEISVSFWTANINVNSGGHIVTQSDPNNPSKVNWAFEYLPNTSNHANKAGSFKGMYNTSCSSVATNELYHKTLSISNWNHVVYTISSTGIFNIYLNGTKVQSSSLSAFPSCNTQSGVTLRFGGPWHSGDPLYFNGTIDDIGIWNRALSSSEINQLYQTCQLISQQPVNYSGLKGSSSIFTLTAISGTSFQWQSNSNNLNWTNIPNNSSYSGATTSSLTISNLSLSNHKQLFRVITSNGSCKDTSKEVEINIEDTCINIKNISVADTLKFNINLTGINPPNNKNFIKIYPNPSFSSFTIDNGNYTQMKNYSIKIVNSIGQQVFSTTVDKQIVDVDINTLGGKGLYALSITDNNGLLLETKMILLQ